MDELQTLKSITQVCLEANALREVDDLRGLIDLCDYLLANVGRYTLVEWDYMIEHLWSLERPINRYNAQYLSKLLPYN